MLCRKITILILFCLFSGCQVYQSPDRKDFENDRGQFQIQNYRIQSCSDKSALALAESSEVLFKDAEVEVSKLTWQGLTLIEAKYQQGDYCVLAQK